MAREKSKVLTPTQQKIVDAKLEGKSDNQAIRGAGINSNNAAMVRSAQVQEAIKEAREGIKDATTLTRLDIIDGIMSAIEMARLQAEPATMIQGYDKLAKIIGAYEPVKHEISIDESGQLLLHKMRNMSREQLAMIAEGTGRVINGEFVRVDN